MKAIKGRKHFQDDMSPMTKFIVVFSTIFVFYGVLFFGLWYSTNNETPQPKKTKVFEKPVSFKHNEIVSIKGSHYVVTRKGGACILTKID